MPPAASLPSLPSSTSSPSPSSHLPGPIPPLDNEIILEIFHAWSHSGESYPSSRSAIEQSVHAPHYLGRVCRTWHALIRHTPSLWSKIVVHIDRGGGENKTYPGPSIQEYALRSQGLPLRVYLIRKIEFPPSLDETEVAVLSRPLAALGTHSSRVTTFVIQTNQSSSLPSARRLINSFGNLKTLCLVANVDDSPLVSLPTPSSASLGLSGSPSLISAANTLQYLALDGRDVLALLSDGWDFRSAFVSVHTLHINHLTSRTDGFSESPASIERLFDVLCQLRSLKTLLFMNFDVPAPAPIARRVGSDMNRAACSRLVMKQITPTGLLYLLTKLRRPEEICIGQSPFIYSTFALLRCTRLILTHSTDPNRAIERGLLQWEGDHLEIHSSKFLTDGFFGGLETRLTDVSSCLLNLRTLKVVDCPMFSPITLIRLLNVRFRMLSSQPLHRHLARLESLEVCGSSQKLERRFREIQEHSLEGIVDSFRWDVE